MKANVPFISIIIPTLNSQYFLKLCLGSIVNQDYPKDKFEVIIVDNGSCDKTVELAKSLGVIVFLHAGIPPQVCQQRNLGIKKARGDYLIVLDHDMELPNNFLKEFAAEVTLTGGQIDAWYIPEKVLAKSRLSSRVRTLEKRFYDGSIMCAARVFKREIIRKTRGYDPTLSDGPADWDMDIQLRLAGAKFKTLKDNLYHHEENLPFIRHITKKNIYIVGSSKYKNKWKKKNATMYDKIVKKQFSPIYRYILVFVENGRCRSLILSNLDLFLILYLSKILVGLVYILNKFKTKVL